MQFRQPEFELCFLHTKWKEVSLCGVKALIGSVQVTDLEYRMNLVPYFNNKKPFPRFSFTQGEFNSNSFEEYNVNF